MVKTLKKHEGEEYSLDLISKHLDKKNIESGKRKCNEEDSLCNL